MAHRLAGIAGRSIVGRPLCLAVRREHAERLLGQGAVIVVAIGLVVGLDVALPSAEHVDALWLGLLLAVMASAWMAGVRLGLVVVALATATLVLSFGGSEPGAPVAQDLVALAFFVAASSAGAIAVGRLRPAASEAVIARPSSVRNDPDALTAREITILGLLDRGLSNDEIARLLVVSPNTVKTHLEHLYGKLAVRSRGRAVAEGRRRGLIA